MNIAKFGGVGGGLEFMFVVDKTSLSGFGGDIIEM
jgi:hypothetical protein